MSIGADAKQAAAQCSWHRFSSATKSPNHQVLVGEAWLANPPMAEGVHQPARALMRKMADTAQTSQAIFPFPPSPPGLRLRDEQGPLEASGAEVAPVSGSL